MPSTYPQHLTGPDHYARAEQLIQLAEDQRNSNTSSPDRAIATATLAMAHFSAARLAWEVSSAIFDSNTAADWEQASQVLSAGMLTGWPEAIR